MFHSALRRRPAAAGASRTSASRSERSDTRSASTSNTRSSSSRRIAPAVTMSLRSASSPGMWSFCLAVVFPSRLAIRVTSLRSSARWPAPAGDRPRSSAAIAATARIVPDVPTAVLTFARRTGLRRRSRRLLTARRRRRSSFAERGSDETKRSVRRTAPRSRLSARRIRSPFATTTSVDPPPMSRTRSGSHEGGSSERTARVMSRASSSPEITARRSPVSLRTRLTNSSPFAASRTAHVATAVIAPAPAARASAA